MDNSLNDDLLKQKFDYDLTLKNTFEELKNLKYLKADKYINGLDIKPEDWMHCV